MFRDIIPQFLFQSWANKVARTEGGMNTVLLNQQFIEDFDRTLSRYSKILSDVFSITNKTQWKWTTIIIPKTICQTEYSNAEVE